MKIVDWRHVDARALALVFARERARWIVELGWDTQESWLHVERARTTWGLPGLAAIDESGRVRGVTFFHASGSQFDVGGVFAESEKTRQALLDAAIGVCEEAGGGDVKAFLYAGASPSAEQLTERGFELEEYDYLRVDIGAPEGARVRGFEGSRAGAMVRGFEGAAGQGWKMDDVTPLAALLSASYEPQRARQFVREFTATGWGEYVGNLARHSACGTVLPNVTRLVWAGERLVGAVLVTRLGPATAHIAQLAVHPMWRQKGLGGSLVDEAARLARDESFNQMTLLASATNSAAQALYRDRGYLPAARFISVTKKLVVDRTARAS